MVSMNREKNQLNFKVSPMSPQNKQKDSIDQIKSFYEKLDKHAQQKKLMKPNIVPKKQKGNYNQAPMINYVKQIQVKTGLLEPKHSSKQEIERIFESVDDKKKRLESQLQKQKGPSYSQLQTKMTSEQPSQGQLTQQMSYSTHLQDQEAKRRIDWQKNGSILTNNNKQMIKTFELNSQKTNLSRTVNSSGGISFSTKSPDITTGVLNKTHAFQTDRRIQTSGIRETTTVDAHQNVFKLESYNDDLVGQQKLVWQQLQILKLIRNDLKSIKKSTVQGRVVAQQITHQYGFQMSEEEMFNRIFKYNPAYKTKQNFAQLECLECLKLTNKMLAEELNLLIEAQRKRGAQITFDRSKLNENNFSKRSKSNNGPSNIFSGEISVEQAAQLLHRSPQIFMRRTINDPYFAPIVTGQGLMHATQAYTNVTLPDRPPPQVEDQIVPKQSFIHTPQIPKKIRHQNKNSFDENANQLIHVYEGHTKKYNEDFAPTTLKQPVLQAYKHLKKCNINQTFQKINQIVLILFKQKAKPEDAHMIKLLKYFNIAIPKGHGFQLDWLELKKPDFQQAVNVKLMQKLYKVLNQENKNAKPETGSNYFKFFIGAGNNYPGVRQIIKRRSWWHKGKREMFVGMNQTQAYEQESDESAEDGKSMGAHFIWTQWKKPEITDFLKGRKTGPQLIYSKLEDNFHLANKKALFMNISNYYRSLGYDPFEVAIPLTFHIKSPQDPECQRFIQVYNQFKIQKGNANIWIIKPGENSNRGCGIQVSDNLQEIKNIVKQIAQSNGNRTAIVQRYLDKPMLVHGRKFDIRAYAMLTSINGSLKGYMYRDCYFRTSSKPFDLSNLQSRFIHLTNDAVQVNSEDYGKFENGNKMSINDFQRYLDSNYQGKNILFMRDLFPQMERLVTDSFRAVYNKIDPGRLSHSFEVFGYDFMIDENFKVYLIEANTNPSLEICSPLLARIIPELLDNSFRIAIDPIFQPPMLVDELKQYETKEETKSPPRSQNEQRTYTAANLMRETTLLTGQQKQRRKFELISNIKYQLVFDEAVDRQQLELLAENQAADQPLMAEIAEEEQIAAIQASKQQSKQQSVEQIVVQQTIEAEPELEVEDGCVTDSDLD